MMCECGERDCRVLAGGDDEMGMISCFLRTIAEQEEEEEEDEEDDEERRCK